MIVALHIDAIVHGGEGLARHEGRVVFVRGAAPGDLVEVDVSAAGFEDRSGSDSEGRRGNDAGHPARDPERRPGRHAGAARFEHARVLRVLERGAARVDAPCPIVDRCGGCPVQQISYAAQLEAKHALTADALERIGGLPRGSYTLAPIVASPSQLRYRRRARMHRAEGGQWGFAARAASARSPIQPVDECLLFEPALQALADSVRAFGDLPGVIDLGLLTSPGGKGAVDLRTEKPPTNALRLRARKLLESTRGLSGLTLGPAATSGPSLPELIGDPVLIDPPLANGARLRTRPNLFAQANREAVPLLQAAVRDALGDSQRLLELFCGSGTLTLPLLGGGALEVTAVESAGPALGLLRRSADEAGLSVKLIEGDASAIARTEIDVDAVLLDPPRTGAAQVVRGLAQWKPQRIVYVSCDAPTLARDARLLVAAGYRLHAAVPIDLFPQTAHFEVVATFLR